MGWGVGEKYNDCLIFFSFNLRVGKEEGGESDGGGMLFCRSPVVVVSLPQGVSECG